MARAGAQCADASRARLGRSPSCCRGLAQALRRAPWSAGGLSLRSGLRSVWSRRGWFTSSCRRVLA
eukprot:14411127-Alexandrium_andersonii.AAC.1